jgi:hypothetical protein
LRKKAEEGGYCTMDDNIQKIGNKLLIRSLMAIHAPGLMASSSFKLAKVRIGNVPMTFVPQKI